MIKIKNKSLINNIILLLIIVSLIPMNSGCKKKEVKAPAEKVLNVHVKTAEKRRLRPFIETIGSLNPYEEIIVSAEVDGIIKDVKVDEGSLVSKGDATAMIDDTDYSLEVKRAEAALRQAESTLSNAQLEYKRKELLYKEELVTKQQFDDVSTRLSLAEADVDRAKASLLLARQRLSKTIIRSPLTGVIKERKVSAGDFVRSGTNAFVIIQKDRLKLNFAVPERDIGKIKAGQDVILRVAAIPKSEFKGKVTIIYPSVDEKTRTLHVEALVPNPGVLKPGMFASVVLFTDLPVDTVVVPITSILYEGELTKVFVIENGTARERVVRVGQKYGEMVEITDGVAEGELIVIRGQHNLFDGVKVNVAR